MRRLFALMLFVSFVATAAFAQPVCEQIKAKKKALHDQIDARKSDKEFVKAKRQEIKALKNEWKKNNCKGKGKKHKN
jgi:hypothetical protein